MRISLVPFALLLLSAAPLHGQQITFAYMAPAEQLMRPDGTPTKAPVVCTSINHTATDFVHRVGILNRSDKTLVFYRLGWVVRSYDQATHDAGEDVYFADVGREVQAEIKAGEHVWSPNQLALPARIEEQLRAKGVSGKVVFLVGVVYAKFSDGTEWMAEVKDFRRILDPENLGGSGNPSSSLSGCNDCVCGTDFPCGAAFCSFRPGWQCSEGGFYCSCVRGCPAGAVELGSVASCIGSRASGLRAAQTP